MAKPWEKAATASPPEPAPAPASTGRKPWEKAASAAPAQPSNGAEAAPVGSAIAAAGAGPGYANPARISSLTPTGTPLKPSQPAVIDGYKGNQFPTNWPKGMAAPPKAPDGYEWQDTGYSYDLKQAAPKDYVSMSPAQLRQMRADQAAEQHRQDLMRKSNDLFEMQDGSPLYMRDDGTLAQNSTETLSAIANLEDRNLGIRATKSAINTAGPGLVNFALEAGDAGMRNLQEGGFYGQPANLADQPRIMFGGENKTTPELWKAPEIPLSAPQSIEEAGADMGGQLAGYILGPGKFVEAGMRTVGVGAKAAPGVSKAMAAITPQGASAVDRAVRYGGRLAGLGVEGVAHAGMFGGVVGEDGQRLETAEQFAADPLNWAATPLASILYRGVIGLKNLGSSVTPEAVQLRQAVGALQSGRATPEQAQAAADVIDRLTPPAPSAAPTPPVQPPAPQAAAQTAPQPPAPVQTATAPSVPPQPPVGGPPVATGAAGNPPGVPVAQAGQAPPAGTLTPAGNGVAVDSFNALPVKTREGVLRALEASGMTRPQAFDAIRSLNDLPPDRANMFEFELIRRFGAPDRFPDLEANLTAMGSDFSMQTGRKGGSPQKVMNNSLLDQAQSEGEYLTRMAEDIFGEGKVATKEQLDTYRQTLGGKYQDILSQTYPGLARKRNPQVRATEQARIDTARKNLTDYLLRDDVMRNVPPWVQDQVMLQISNDLRYLRFDDAGRDFVLRGNPELQPLMSPDRELIYSPQVWKTLSEMYPTQVAHSLQSAYRQAIDTAMMGTDAAARTAAKRLMRMRGQSKVRSNAADPNMRGYGLLHLIEEAAPGYKEVRQAFGDVVGAQKAADMPNNFFRIAKDEEALADFRDVFENELTPLQQDAVRNGITTQIRQALKNKTEFTRPWELDAIERGHLPNLTAVSSQPFLDALPRVFGRDGERMADAIRLSRANVDNIQAINKNFASGTPKGMEIQKNARNLYEAPSATDANPIDAMTGTLAGVGGMGAMTGNMSLALPALGGAAARGLYRMYKRGKSLSPAQKQALAEWLFKPRRSTDAVPRGGPRGFSKLGYGGNVLTGAAVGAGAGAASSGGDPLATAEGALIGAGAGGLRAGLRSRRAGRSIIPPGGGPRGGNRLRTGGNPPPVTGPRTPRPLPGQTSPASPTVTGALVGGAAGYAASDGDPTATVAGAIGGGGIGAGIGSKLGGNKLARGPKPPGGPKAPPRAPVAAPEAPRGPAAPVSAMPESMRLASARLKDGSTQDVAADVFTDNGVVVVSPSWPTNAGNDLSNALVNRSNELRSPRKGLKVVDDQYAPKAPFEPSAKWSSQNPQEMGDLTKQVADRFIGLSRNGDAHVLALTDEVDLNSLASYLEANIPSSKTLVATRDGGEIAIVSKRWLRDNGDRFSAPTWEPLYPSYNQSKGLRPAPADWASPKAPPASPSTVKPPGAPKPYDSAGFGGGGKSPPRGAALPRKGYEEIQFGPASVGVTRDGDQLTINSLKVPEAERGKGAASRALDEVLQRADAEGATVFLTPERIGTTGLTDAQLKAFYSRHGFVSNRGRDRDFTTRATMVRRPQPVQNGFGGSKLPMDEASRMQRARDMGFDTDRVAYRGLGRAYDESGKGGGRRYQMFTSSESDAAEYGSNVVSAYLRKGNNLKLDGGGRNFNSVSVSQLPDDVRAKLHPSIQGVARIDDIADAAQKAGYDSVTVANVFDNAWGEVPTKPRPRTQKDIDLDDELLRELGVDPADVPSAPRAPDAPKKNTDPVTIDVVFDTKNIRSKDAAFDPSQSSSSKLLAGFGNKATLASAGGGIAYGELGPLQDMDGDGDKDAEDRQAMRVSYGMGGMMTPLLIRGGVGMAKAAGNKLRGVKAPPKPASGPKLPAQIGYGGGKGTPKPPKVPGYGKVRIAPGVEVLPPDRNALKPNKRKAGKAYPIEGGQSAEELAARKELRDAKAANTRARSRFVMRDNREALWAEADAREARAMDNLNRVLERQAAKRQKSAKMRDAYYGVKDFVNSERGGLTAGLGVAGLTVAGVLGAGMVMGGGEKKKAGGAIPETDPRYFMTKLKGNKDNLSAVQNALVAINMLKPDSADGNWGTRSADGISAYLQSIPGRNPNLPLQEYEVPALLAKAYGGYQDTDGKWYYDDGQPITFPVPNSRGNLPDRTLTPSEVRRMQYEERIRKQKAGAQ